MKKPLLVLVDGSAVFHRGYHAIPHLSTRDGTPTNAVLGFANIMFKVIESLQPAYVVVTWDKSSKTFRNELYPAYKATRVKQPDDLYAQIPTTRELVEALRMPWVELENYEADDIIGTLARQAEERGDLEIVIATGDKDQLQLIDKATVVDMFNPRGLEPTRYDLAKMQERYGLTPQQFIDYKALVGDASDNIPGVKGIGDKGAIKLLALYQTLDGIYEHANEIVGSVGEKLRAEKEMAYLSRKLSVIVCDAPVKLDLDAAKVRPGDYEKLSELFRRLEFRSLMNKLPELKREVAVASGAVGEVAATGPLTLFGDEAGPAKPRREHLDAVKYTAVTTEAALEELASKLEQQPVFAFDTETTSVDTMSADLVGLSVAFTEGEAYYVPVGHDEGEQLASAVVLDRLRPVLENLAVGKTGHNVKFDYEVLRRHGIRVQGIAFDTMIAAFLLNSVGRSQSLDDLAYSELGIEMIPISEMIGVGKAQISFNGTNIEEAATYAAEDADISWRLYERLKGQLEQWREVNEYGWSMERLATEVEWPIVPVLGEMEIAGIKLDTEVLATFGKRLEKRIGELKGEIYDQAGEEFNLGSPAQLGQILYGRLALPVAGLKKGKTGVSTAADVLEKLRGVHPIIPLIMEYRELDKLKNTYVDALPAQVGADGRVHTSFSQTIAQTGRLSSTNPNLQNIPVRTELGREIRTAFVAPEGRVLVSADYSQIELRVAAALAGDQDMIATFKAGIDLHQQTAAELYGVPLEEVTKEQRSASKTINFGVLYGMSPHGLSVATGMDGKEAAGFIERYFEVRPKLKEYIEATKKFAYDKQYTATLFGRRRACPEVRSSNFQIRSSAERVAVNVPIQGTAADIYKLAMIELARRLGDDCDLLLQIHDELIVEAPEAKGEQVAALMAEVMSGVIDLGVPLAVDTAVGNNWGAL
ncbi:MAG TPA: DNA polymerase I [Candidatus Saccharimonadia bacterium]|nr:DNA polymerase I [Candidatus Saccharimonadia bacterium]